MKDYRIAKVYAESVRKGNRTKYLYAKFKTRMKKLYKEAPTVREVL